MSRDKDKIEKSEKNISKKERILKFKEKIKNSATNILRSFWTEILLGLTLLIFSGLSIFFLNTLFLSIFAILMSIIILVGLSKGIPSSQPYLSLIISFFALSLAIGSLHLNNPVIGNPRLEEKIYKTDFVQGSLGYFPDDFSVRKNPPEVSYHKVRTVEYIFSNPIYETDSYRINLPSQCRSINLGTQRNLDCHIENNTTIIVKADITMGSSSSLVIEYEKPCRKPYIKDEITYRIRDNFAVLKITLTNLGTRINRYLGFFYLGPVLENLLRNQFYGRYTFHNKYEDLYLPSKIKIPKNLKPAKDQLIPFLVNLEANKDTTITIRFPKKEKSAILRQKTKKATIGFFQVA